MLISMWAFVLYFICTEVHGKANDVEMINVKEGDVLNLHPGLDDLKGEVQILWTFESGRHKTRVAQLHEGKMYTHYDMRFTGRVKLDRETGTLTISDIKINECGLYKALIVNNKLVSGRGYKVDVYASVSVPAIRRSSSVTEHLETGTSREMKQICKLFCSVKNERDVFISWYKDGEIVNQSSNPDLNISLSLPLELHYEDPENYSCTAANPVSNKSVRLHVKEICSRQEDCEGHCGITEALIRLVLSGLLGIVTIIFIFEHVRLCSTQKRDAASV